MFHHEQLSYLSSGTKYCIIHKSVSEAKRPIILNRKGDKTGILMFKKLMGVLKENSRLGLLRMTHKKTENCLIEASIALCLIPEPAIIPATTAFPSGKSYWNEYYYK